jgi:hypothetical protein
VTGAGYFGPANERYSGPKFQEFDTEEAAADFVESYLAPFCRSLVREPVLKNGLRPDIGFRLSHDHLKAFPLVVEVKKFRNGNVSELVAAVRQAHSYTAVTGHIAVVGPIEARGPTHLAWYGSPIGAIGLVAAQFSVGYLYVDRDRSGGIFIGGQSAVRFDADGTLTVHSNAETLLRRKQFSGSATWREVA